MILLKSKVIFATIIKNEFEKLLFLVKIIKKDLLMIMEYKLK
jgi:hypothetical protein